MVGSITGIMSRVGRYGEYGANFILGTGSETIGQEVRNAVKARKATGAGLTSSIFDGFTRGVSKTNAQVNANGFWKHLKNTFSSLPSEMGSGWKNANVAGKGTFAKYLTKAGQFLKPIGKTMPFIFNALFLLSAIPNAMERAQDDGILGGIAEIGKTVGKMGFYALGSAIGAAFGGVGMFAGAMVAGVIADSLFGKDYSQQKEEKQEKMAKISQKFFQQQNNSNTQNINYNA
jgi:hypothetical protein